MKYNVVLKYFSITITSFLITTCDRFDKRIYSDNDANNLAVQFSFGQEGDFVFSQPWDIAQDSVGTFFISDMGVPAVYQVDNDGKLLRSFGREGRGPGEYEYPKLIEIDDEWVYIADGYRLITFNKKNDSSNTVVLDRYLTEFDVSDNKIYGFAPGAFNSVKTPQEEKLIGVYTKQGEKKGTFGNYLSSDEPLPAGVSWPLINIEEDIIHLVFKYFPLYRAYTKDGKLIVEQDLSKILPDSAKSLQTYDDPNSDQKRFSPSSTGTVNVTFINRALNVYKNRVFISRQAHKVVIDEYLFENDSLRYISTHYYDNDRLAEDYYILDIIYQEESNSFSILEYNNSIAVTIYSLLKK